MNKKMSKKKKRKMFLLCSVIIILVIMFCYSMIYQTNQNKETFIYQEYTAQKGTLQSGVTESGTVTLGLTTQEYDLDVTTSDDDEDDEDEEDIKYLQVEEVYAAVGQRILSGEPIYKFSEKSIDAVRKALTYEQVEAKIALSQAQAENEVGIVTASLSKDEKELAYALAQQDYDVTIATITQEATAKWLQIEQLLSEIQDTQLDLVDEDYREQMNDLIDSYEDAKDDYKDILNGDYAFTKRLEATQQLNNAQNSYEQFMDQFDQSSEQINEKLEQITSLQNEIMQDSQLVEKTLLAASQTLESTNVSGSIAKEQYENNLKSYTSSSKKAQETLDEANEKLQAFEEFIGDGTIYASGDGIITEMGYAIDDYLINTGILLAYASADDKSVSVDVSEEDVVSIQVGDTVKVQFSAYADTEYTGKVESITTTATSRSTATISYPVVISIQGDTDKLFGGMTADVTFVTDEMANVINVPRKAIIDQNGKKYIYKKVGNEYMLCEVSTGFTDGENVEIVAGLTEGENYYIQKEGETDEAHA